MTQTPNLILGWCFSAVAIAAISILIWGYTTFVPVESGGVVCRVPVSIEESEGVRLGCATELDPEKCSGIGPGDHIKWEAGACVVVAGGMESQFRLASNLPLELNKVSKEDLQFLEGVGPVLARAVVEYRQINGPFVSVDNLLNVRGIGPKTLERLRMYLVVGNQQLNGNQTELVKE